MSHVKQELHTLSCQVGLHVFVQHRPEVFSPYLSCGERQTSPLHGSATDFKHIFVSISTVDVCQYAFSIANTMLL
jgi:hypothetical protein